MKKKKKQKRQNYHSQKECLTIIIPRDVIEDGNVLEVSLLLEPLVYGPPIKEFRNNIEIIFKGYDEGPYDLVHIAKIREFMQGIDKRFPYWFYFINKESHTLRVITGLLCDIENVGTQSRLPIISTKQLCAFIDSHCLALTDLNLTTKDFKNTVKEVIHYYFDGYVDEAGQQDILNMIMAKSRAA